MLSGPTKSGSHIAPKRVSHRFDFSLKEKYKDIAKSDEDVLSIALFEAVAIKFLEQRNKDLIPTEIKVKA